MDKIIGIKMRFPKIWSLKMLFNWWVLAIGKNDGKNYCTDDKRQIPYYYHYILSLYERYDAHLWGKLEKAAEPLHNRIVQLAAEMQKLHIELQDELENLYMIQSTTHPAEASIMDDAKHLRRQHETAASRVKIEQLRQKQSATWQEVAALYERIESAETRLKILCEECFRIVQAKCKHYCRGFHKGAGYHLDFGSLTVGEQAARAYYFRHGEIIKLAVSRLQAIYTNEEVMTYEIDISMEA